MPTIHTWKPPNTHNWYGIMLWEVTGATHANIYFNGVLRCENIPIGDSYFDENGVFSHTAPDSIFYVSILEDIEITASYVVDSITHWYIPETIYFETSTNTLDGKICVMSYRNAYGNDDHGEAVFNSFCQALYDLDCRWIGEVVYANITLSSAAALGCDSYIISTTGLQSKILEASYIYPSIQVIMPSGDNNHIQIYTGGLITIIVTGAGDDANETGYNTEFYSNDPLTPEKIPDEADLSSFSNGYIAGFLTYIANTLNISIWGARYLVRQALGNTWNNENGYGKITSAVALNAISLYDPSINYNFIDPFIPHIGSFDPNVNVITGNRLGQSVNLTLTSVSGATIYEIRRDNIAIATQSGTSYTDTIRIPHMYDYRAGLLNKYNEIEWTPYSKRILIKYGRFNQIVW